MQLLGSGSVHLDNPNNDVTTLAANFSGPISYTDKTALTVGIVGDSFSGMTSTGITSSSNDVKLTAGGDLAINQAVNTGTANLTLSDTGNVTQSASGILTAGGLQLLAPAASTWITPITTSRRWPPISAARSATPIRPL